MHLFNKLLGIRRTGENDIMAKLYANLIYKYSEVVSKRYP